MKAERCGAAFIEERKDVALYTLIKVENWGHTSEWGESEKGSQKVGS